MWLVTLSKTLPFTFVDHALRHGDSLVGLDFDQIRAFHWAPEKQVDFCEKVLRGEVAQAVELRQQILNQADHEDSASQADKRRLLEFSQQAIERVRLVADVCVGAFFAEAKDAAREKERLRRQRVVEEWLGGDEGKRPEIEDLARELHKKVMPFHWWLEFPEVFSGASKGGGAMDGVVGNPPFLGGRIISGTHGDTYADWLFLLHGHSKNADLSAHFFRRSARLIDDHGAFGLVATNTIAQGDTRAVGLKHLLDDGWILFDATSSMAWPGSAAVTVSLVHAASGTAAAASADYRLDARAAAAIDSRLRPKTRACGPEGT